MVDMGMGEQDCAERFGVEAQISVLPMGFVSASLKEPAIQQEFEARHLKHMAAPRY
jgi:hypothetical protein